MYAWQLRTMIDKGRVLTDNTNYTLWFMFLHVRACTQLILISTRDSAHMTSVHVCVCSCSSCPDQRDDCNLSACMITCIWWEQCWLATSSFAYHTDGKADSDKSGCYAWFVCHDISSVLLTQAYPTMMKHLTSMDNGTVYCDCGSGVATPGPIRA